MPEDTTSPAAAEEKGFEEVLGELTRVVERLEKGNLPLQDSIALYTRGVELLQQARRTLDQAQARLEVLIGTGEQGPVVEGLDPEPFTRDG